MARLVIYLKRMKPGHLCRISKTATGRQALTLCYRDGGRNLTDRDIAPSEQVKLELVTRELIDEKEKEADEGRD